MMSASVTAPAGRQLRALSGSGKASEAPKRPRCGSRLGRRIDYGIGLVGQLKVLLLDTEPEALVTVTVTVGREPRLQRPK
jgi:hypothetical protein